MLKRNFIIVAIISLSVFLTSNTFGQITKRKRIQKKTKVVTTTNVKIANPKPLATNLMKGHEGMQEREAGSGNATGARIPMRNTRR